MTILSGNLPLFVTGLAGALLVYVGSDYLYLNTNHYAWKYSKPLVTRLWGALFVLTGVYLFTFYFWQIVKG